MTQGLSLKKLEIFFDFLSPFSYLATQEFARLNLPVEVIWRPVVMGTLIHSYETKGPAEIPSKRDYLFRQILRLASRAQIPLQVPDPLPFNSLEALRICIYWQQQKRDISSLVHAFFAASWGRGEDLGQLEVLEQIQAQCGLNEKLARAGSGSREVRIELKDNLKRAQELGVFGVPSFILHNETGPELFWGRDSLPDLIDTLAGATLPHPEIYARYRERFQ